MDSKKSVESNWFTEIAKLGAYVSIDHVGSTDHEYINDSGRVELVLRLIEAGFTNRIPSLVKCNWSVIRGSW